MQTAPHVPTTIAKSLNLLKRKEYFDNIRSPEISLDELLSYHYSYDGRLYGDQISMLNCKIKELAQKECKEQSFANDLVTIRGHIPLDALNLVCPKLGLELMTDAGVNELQFIQLLEESHNEWFSTELPPKLGHKSRRQTRGSFGIYQSKNSLLFCSPLTFMCFSDDYSSYISAASSRLISRAGLDVPTLTVDMPIVLIHDYGDGTSFAHFAFDWLTRILHTVSASGIDHTNCLYVMGGDRTDFHNAFLDSLSLRFGINPANFYYPNKPTIIKSSSCINFFTDHNIDPLHPAQICHPESVEMLKTAANDVLWRHEVKCMDLPKKVFVSRDDAKFRKIINENELRKIADSHDFKTINLGAMSFQEQISVIANAHTIVGAHGMGFTHIIFCKHDFSLSELFHPTIGTDAYVLMTKALGGDHSFVIGESIPDNQASYSIDVDLFRTKLNS